MTHSSDTQSGPLKGVTVLDIGLLVQGPQAAAAMQDMGADVIKVELPGMGDHARWIFCATDDPRSAYFTAVNRGKRGMTIDLRKPEGVEVFLRLVDRADVLISNFKPGTLEEWGLGFDVLSARNPRLIWGSGSAFGTAGPDALREGADLAGQSAGGLISTVGEDGQPPSPVGVTIADHIASQNLTAGVLAALFAREQTGRGQKVEVSLLGGLGSGSRVHPLPDDGRSPWQSQLRSSPAARHLQDCAHSRRLAGHYWCTTSRERRLFPGLGQARLGHRSTLRWINRQPGRPELFVW